MFILVYIIGIAGFIYLCKKMIKIVFRTKDRPLDELAGLVKTKYQGHATIERLFYPDHPLPIEQCYLHLALVEEKSLKAQPNNSDSQEIIKESREYFLHEYERIQHIQRKLKPEELLTECRQAQKRIYIEGAAGAGKTTLSQFIAYQWAKGRLPWQQYEFIFRVRLRDLTEANYPESKIDLLHVIEKQCFKRGYSNALTESEKHNLTQYLKSKDKKVLFILDGYDELSLERKAINDLWESIIQSDYDFIITSRPGMQKTDLKTNLNIAVLGFSDEQVKKYIHYFFDPEHTPDVNVEDASHCLQTFRQNINLWSLAHTPIQLELLCNIWSDELKLASDITLTHIYTLMLEQLLKRYKQKHLENEKHKKVTLSDIDIEPLLEKFAVHLEFLENSAFFGMERSNFVIPHNDIEEAYKGLTVKPKDKADFFATLRKSGLITRDSDGKQIEFNHLTFQEYFAARYIVRCFRMQQSPKSYSILNEFIAKQKYYRRYEIVWWFVAGLLKDEMELLDEYFNILQSEPNDLAQVYQFSLQLQCLTECELQLREKSKDELLNQVVVWIQKLSSINYIHPLVEVFNIPTRIINQKKIIEALLTSIKACTFSYRYWYFRKISNLPASILQWLMELLNNENTQKYAASILYHQTSLSEINLQQLIELLKDKNIQKDAASILYYQTALPDSILQQLVGLLNDENTQASAARALYKQTEFSELLLQRLVELLNDENTQGHAQLYAASTLSRQTVLPELILQQLSKLLNDKKTLMYAARALSRLTIFSEPIFKKLVELLNDENAQIHAAAVLSAQTVLPDPILQQLVELLNDENARIHAAAVLSAQTVLPDSIVQQLVELLNDKNKQRYAVEALSSQTALSEPALQQLVKLLNNEKVAVSAATALSYQTALSGPILQQLVGLLNDEKAQYYSVIVLSHQTAFSESILQQLSDIIINKNAYWPVAKVLSSQTQLPKELLVSISTRGYGIIESISSVTIASLCGHLNRHQYDSTDISILKLIMLKCFEQKLSLNFYKNTLYVGGEMQGEFLPECQEQMTQELEKLFTEMTGIPASASNKENLFDMARQLSRDTSMEAKTSANKQGIETVLVKREEIILDIDGITQAIKDQISDTSLQKILTDLLKEAQEKQALFNKSSLQNHTFCQSRDKFISRIKSIMQTVSKNEKYKEDHKDVALTQIFPDILFPFWRCRPYPKIETTKEAEQNQQKEQQLFWQQQQLRAQSTFLETLTQIRVARELLITAKPKIYFMYAWPLGKYQLRESQVQSFLQGLHDDLTAAGIEVIFDKEDNFSGNNLNQFMGQILDANCIVLVFGTESFRHKWFEHKTALHYEGDLLKLKWLTDLSEGKIKANQGITIVPWVLTGIRETAIPEDLLPAKNTTVRALYSMNYCEVLTTILAVAYGITEQAFIKYFTHIKLTTRLIVQQRPSQVINNTNQRMHETTSLATTTLFASSKTTKKETTIPHESAHEKNNNKVAQKRFKRN